MHYSESDLHETCSLAPSISTNATADDFPGTGRILGKVVYDILGHRVDMITIKAVEQVGRGPRWIANRIRRQPTNKNSASHEENRLHESSDYSSSTHLTNGMETAEARRGKGSRRVVDWILRRRRKVVVTPQREDMMHESAGYSSSIRLTDTTTIIRPGFFVTSSDPLSQDREFEEIEELEDLEEFVDAEEFMDDEEPEISKNVEETQEIKKPGNLMEVEELDIVDHPYLGHMPGSFEGAYTFDTQVSPRTPRVCQAEHHGSIELMALTGSSVGRSTEEALMLESQPATKKQALVITPFILFSIAFLIAFGIAKAVATQRGQTRLANALDWTWSLPISLFITFLTYMKEQNICAGLRWFLYEDFRIWRSTETQAVQESVHGRV